MIRTAIIIGVWLSVAVTGCCPITSLHPLGTPDEAIFDPRIAGTWYGGSTANDGAFVHFGKGPGNRTQVLVVEHKPDGLMEQVTFPVFISRVDDQFFMNIDLQQLKLKEVNGHSGYVLVKYHLPDADTLVFCEMDEKKLARAVTESRVAGEITYEKPTAAAADEQMPPEKIDCVRLTDTTGNLRKFMASKDADQLFLPYMTLKRVKP